MGGNDALGPASGRAVLDPGAAVQPGARARRATTPFLSLGVNNGKTVYRPDTAAADDEYGSLASIVASWKELGVAFVRQPGETDLMFPPSGTGSRDPELPLVADLGAELAERIRPGIEALFSLVCGDDDAPGVVLTLLTLGGAVQGWSAGEQPGPFAAETVVPANFSLHAGQRLTDPADASRAYDFPGGDGFDAYHQGTLDLSNDYKLCWVQYFARAVGEMLVEVAAALGVDAATFGGKLVGIEVFNEVNTGNRILGAYEGLDPNAADHWARAAARAVVGLVDGFGGRAGDVPSLWLPSLASENGRMTWAGFTSYFHARLVGELPGALRDLVGNDRLRSSFVNQDVHFYRFSSDQGASLAATLADVILGIQDNLAGEGYSGVQVSVCETGASVATQVGVDGDPVLFPQWVYDIVEAGADAEVVREQFQAMEVVRRVVVAAGAGATRVAWNSHIGLADPTSRFYGTGLRRDVEGEDASAKVARRSFGALRRLGDLFQQYGLRNGTIVLPVRPSGETFLDLDLNEAPNGATVVRFEIASTSGLASPYAWFVFFDSAVAFDEAKDEVVLCVSTGADGVYTVATLLPTAVTSGAAASDELPRVTDIEWGDWRAYAIEAGTHDWRLYDSSYPILLFSQHDLAFSVGPCDSPP